MTAKAAELLRTPLYDLHLKLGGKMVAFAGFELPVQYPAGILAEHRHTRSKASLFDVSHLGQVIVRGDDPARALERLVPGDLVHLGEGRMRYTFFTNAAAGILDDLMIVNRGKDWLVIINAGPRLADLEHLRTHLGADKLSYREDRALIALQGPAAAAVLARYAKDCA